MATDINRKLYKRITPTEAFRALYIDFEGFVGKSPSLIGVASEYDFEQVVLWSSLRPAADERDLRVASIDRVAEELIERCKSEDRLVVGFSQAERQQIEEQTEFKLGRFYRDARMIGRRWINRLHRGDVEEWRLKTLLEYLGYVLPRHLGDGKVTKRLRSVLRGLEVNDGDYSGLTPTQKRKWTNLLEYNRIDCFGMRDLVMRAAAEIAVDSA